MPINRVDIKMDPRTRKLLESPEATMRKIGHETVGLAALTINREIQIRAPKGSRRGRYGKMTPSRKQTPGGKGHLARAWTTVAVRHGFWVVGTNHPAARIQDEGSRYLPGGKIVPRWQKTYINVTKKHGRRVETRKPKFLHWINNSGKDVFAKSVVIRGSRYVMKSLKAAPAKIGKATKIFLDKNL